MEGKQSNDRYRPYRAPDARVVVQSDGGEFEIVGSIIEDPWVGATHVMIRSVGGGWFEPAVMPPYEHIDEQSPQGD